MKILLFILLIFVAGCTHGSFNPETKEFSFWSTKEYELFLIEYKDKEHEILIRAQRVDAFEGQKILIDTLNKVIGK